MLYKFGKKSITGQNGEPTYVLILRLPTHTPRRSRILDQIIGPRSRWHADGVDLTKCALRDRRPQVVISTCSTTTIGSEVTHVVKEGRTSRYATFHRPTVLDDYHHGKGAVDINNNNCDNMTSFHDVMRTHRWEMRATAFFLALAEVANAFLAWRSFGPESQRNITHFDFREQLVCEMLNEYTDSTYRDFQYAQQVL